MSSEQPTTYTVRPAGHVAWQQGITTIEEAERARNEAIRLGLTQPVYIIDERTEKVVRPWQPAD